MRFITRDAIRDEVGVPHTSNYYQYADGNPVNITDLDGLCGVRLVRRYYVSSYQTKFNYWAAFAASTTLVWLISYYSKRTGWSVTAITSMVWPIPEPGTVLQLRYSEYSNGHFWVRKRVYNKYGHLIQEKYWRIR